MAYRSFPVVTFSAPGYLPVDGLQVGTLPWLLALFRSVWFPAWLFAGWRGERPRGRPAWPAAVLMVLVLLRWEHEGMSRRACVKQALTDLRWRAALGVPIGTRPPSERTLRDFERFLRQRHPSTGVRRYLLLHEHVVRQCCSQGNLAKTAVYAMDSTPQWCYGAVLDTVRLLGDGLRALGRQWARESHRSLSEVAAQWDLPLLLHKSTKGAYPVDWRCPEARTAVLSDLVRHVLQATQWVRRHVESVRSSMRKSLLRKCRHLLRVITNDLETDEQGDLEVAQRVAADRLISLTDPQARHGHKTQHHRFNGFKVHLLGDLVSGLLVSLSVTPGNQHDATQTNRLIQRAQALCQQLEQVLADTAYGGARQRYLVKALYGVELVSPPPSAAAPRQGRLGRKDIQVDFKTGSATCANGITTTDRRLIWSSDHGVRVPLLQWDKRDCDACPLQAQCRGPSRQGLRVLLHPYEQELRAARAAWQTPQVQQRYRLRAQAERLVRLVTGHGGRRARQWGLGAAQLQAHAIATTWNLGMLAKMVAVSPDRPAAQTVC